MSAVPTASAKPAQSSASHGIAFRPEGASAAADATGVLLALAALLAAAMVALWFAKRKGWLERWLGSVGPAQAGAQSLRVERTLRLSPRTIVYRVADGKDSYLVVESSTNARLTVLAANGEGIGDG